MRTTASYETRHGGHDLLASHRHASPYAALVLDGGHVEVSIDGVTRCGPGTLILHPGFHAHGNRFDACGAHVLNRPLPVGFAMGSRAFRVPDSREAAQCLRDGDPETLRHLLAEAAPLSPDHGPGNWQAAFLAALRESDAGAGLIARRLGLSAAYASRALTRRYGMGPQALRLELRFRQALALIGGDLPLADLAQRAGFADQSHLHRTIRRFSGMTPAQLRRQVKCVQDPLVPPGLQCACPH